MYSSSPPPACINIDKMISGAAVPRFTASYITLLGTNYALNLRITAKILYSCVPFSLSILAKYLIVFSCLSMSFNSSRFLICHFFYFIRVFPSHFPSKYVTSQESVKSLRCCLVLFNRHSHLWCTGSQKYHCTEVRYLPNTFTRVMMENRLVSIYMHK